MDISQNQLSNLYRFAKNILRGKSHFSPEDIVHDVILQETEKGNEFDINIIKKQISNSALNLTLNVRTQNFKEHNKKFSRFETDRYCKKCGEVLPIGMFYLFTSRHGIQNIHCICKKCHVKEGDKYKKKRRQEDPEYRKRYNKQMADWRDRNRARVNEISKRAYQKKKGLLIST